MQAKKFLPIHEGSPLFPVNAFPPLKWRVALGNEYARAIKVARGAHSVKYRGPKH